MKLKKFTIKLERVEKHPCAIWRSCVKMQGGVQGHISEKKIAS